MKNVGVKFGNDNGEVEDEAYGFNKRTSHKEVLLKGAKRWSFSNWLRMVIQELGENSITSIGFCKCDKRN
jgi:hypothetical protein